MSGNPTVSNVVPMPHAAAPATAPPQMPMPMPSMWGGGGSLPWGPGCCPPGGMDALMKCYCDVQAATAFICSVMVQCVQTNPAVVQAIIAAIENSGSSLPTLGVTNGAEAQAGQVGEFVAFSQQINFPAGGVAQTSVSLGILQPGDWDVWAYMGMSVDFVSLYFAISPQPAGFDYTLVGASSSPTTTPEYQTVVSPVGRALTSVPSPIVFSVSINATVAGFATMNFIARRAR